VGDGPLRSDLEKLSKELAIEDITLFAGFQENIVEWLGKMRVFALTSIKEGMPYALLEAMAAGRIVVAHDVGAVREMVSSNSSRILNTKDTVTWAGHLIAALRATCATFALVSNSRDMVALVERTYLGVD
jgi:glycosyltransferase involved in cell wall biosynthesis